MIAAGGQINFQANGAFPNLNYESGRITFTLNIIVNDGQDTGPPNGAYSRMILHLQDTNDAPIMIFDSCGNAVLGSIAGGCISVEENSAHNVPLIPKWSDQDTKVGWKDLHATIPFAVADGANLANKCIANDGYSLGQIKIQNLNILSIDDGVLNYEPNKNGCDLSITVQDNGSPSLFTKADVHIHIVDVNDLPIKPALFSKCEQAEPA